MSRLRYNRLGLGLGKRVRVRVRVRVGYNPNPKLKCHRRLISFRLINLKKSENHSFLRRQNVPKTPKKRSIKKNQDVQKRLKNVQKTE